MNTPQTRRAALVAALRSGDYEQAEGQLRAYKEGDKIGFCCLGVACDLYHQNVEGTWEGETSFVVPNPDHVTDDEDRAHNTVWYDAAVLVSDGDLPEPVRVWFGFRTVDGKYDGKRDDGFDNCLVRDNDGGLPFVDIADIIENEPTGLVV